MSIDCYIFNRKENMYIYMKISQSKATHKVTWTFVKKFNKL